MANISPNLPRLRLEKPSKPGLQYENIKILQKISR